MGDERIGIDAAAFDETDQLHAVGGVHTAGAEGQVLAVHQVQGQALRFLIHGHHGHGGIGTGHLPGGLEGIVSARALDDCIGAQASGGVEDARFHVVRGGVEGQVGIAAFLCQLQTAGQDVHGDDLRGAEQARALHGAQAHRPGPQYGHAVAGADGGQFRTEVAAGQHVAHQQHVLIGQGIRDGIEPVVRKGHAHVFRLAAVDAATQLPAAVAAVVDVALTAEPAGAAKGLHIGGHTLAGAHFAHLAARCHHFAHEFVPQHRAGQGTRHRAVADMQVTGADAGKFHFDDGITRIPYLRQGTFFQPQVIGTVIDQCMHGFSHKPLLVRTCSRHIRPLWRALGGV